MLDMVTDFMGDDIRLGEVAGRAELLMQLVIERQVDVNL